MELFNWALCLVVSATFAAGIQIGPGKDGKAMVYQALSVPTTITKTWGNTTKNATTSDDTSCALQAKKHSWCHLFCFEEETHMCTLYDILLPVNYEAGDDDDNPKIKCFTNVPEGCLDGKQAILEGESQMEGTFEVTCLNKTLIKRCVDGNLVVLEGETLKEATYEATCNNKVLTKRCVDGNQTIPEGKSLMKDNYEVACQNKTLIKRCVDGNLVVLEGETLKEATYEATCNNKVLTKRCVDGNQTIPEGKSLMKDNYEVACQNKTLIKRCVDGNLVVLEGETLKEATYEATCNNKVLTKRCVDGNQTIPEGKSLMKDNYEVACQNKTLIKRCVDGNLVVLEGETLREATYEATCKNKVLTKKCVYNNQTYSDGEILVENCFTITMTCRQGAWDLSEFVPVNGTGNIMVVYIHKTFEESKQCCEGVGARLVIPDDYEALRQYMINNHDGDIFWVGIFNQKWMDGRSVEANNWDSGYPMEDEDCAFLSTYAGLLYSSSCSDAWELRLICQKV